MSRHMMHGGPSVTYEGITTYTFWTHKNGNIYQVYDFTNHEGDDPNKRDKYPPRVSYMNVANGKRYSRSVSDWHRSMTLRDGAD